MKKLFSVFVLVISTFSLGGCFISFDESFDWQDVVSGQTFFYTDGRTEYYVDFSYSGKSYERGKVRGSYESYSFRAEVEYIDSYSVYFESQDSYDDDRFIIYEDGRVYLADIDVEWEPWSTEEQRESLSTDNMILLKLK